MKSKILKLQTLSGCLNLLAFLFALFAVLPSSALAELGVVIEHPQFSALATHTLLASEARIHGMQLKRKGRFSVLKPAQIAVGVQNNSSEKERSWELCRSLIKRGLAREGYCEPIFKYKISRSPNDEFFSELYGAGNTQLPEAWDMTTGDASVKVAVIDTGVDYTHPDLSDNTLVSEGYDFVNDDNVPMDDQGHGSHCAGTIGAKGDNRIGVAGAAWNISIIPIKALDQEGNGSNAAIAAAIDLSVSRGADVISLSLGGPDKSEILRRALEAASDAGVFIAVAAGNETTNNDQTPSYPASYVIPGMLTVAATDSNDDLAEFSNYGASSVHVAAPGVDILSTTPNGKYEYFSGTSMATPLVAGIAALIKSANPDLSGSEIRGIIESTVDPVSSLDGQISTGGRVNASAALASAIGVQPPPPEEGDPSDPEEDPFYFDLNVKKSEFKTKGSSYYIQVEASYEDEEYDETYVYEDVAVELVCSDKKGVVVISTSKNTDEDGLATFSGKLRKLTRKAARALKCTAHSDDSDGGVDSKVFKLKIR